jgi:hypothetical protein
MSGFNGLNGIMRRWFAYPFYPFVFSAYPALALLSVNVGQVQLAAGLRPLLVSVAIGGLLFFIIWLIIRKIHKSAFLTSLWLALFFSYGHVYNLVVEKYPDFKPIPWLPILWLILFFLSIWWVSRPGLTFAGSAAGLNTIALGLVIVALVQISLKAGKAGNSGLALGAEHAPVQSDLILPDNPPDIYYFILDSYGRADLLKQAYGYDNSEFLQGLKERGFYVADCSQTNYVRTEVSLGSSLNMLYLQELDSAFRPDSTSRRVLWNSLKDSAVRYNLEGLGYKTIGFATGFAWLDLTDADVFLSPPPLSSGLTEFETMFIQTTLARHLKDLGWLDPDAIMGQNFRDRFNFIFNSMHYLAHLPGPKLAYIHVISPHPPFVFDAGGNPTYPPDFWNAQRMYPSDLYAKGYKNQLTYLNKKVLEAVDTLISESKTPPVIILQGDHGPWLQPNNKRMWILNAYYLPGHNGELYPKITPVNSFRLVFDAYFGGNYDMLDDVSYFSPVPYLYQFNEVPNHCGE